MKINNNKWTDLATKGMTNFITGTLPLPPEGHLLESGVILNCLYFRISIKLIFLIEHKTYSVFSSATSRLAHSVNGFLWHIHWSPRILFKRLLIQGGDRRNHLGLRISPLFPSIFDPYRAYVMYCISEMPYGARPVHVVYKEENGPKICLGLKSWNTFGARVIAYETLNLPVYCCYV